MSEGLIKRIGRIISASTNALVDNIENAAPQLVMEQAIREIDGAIQEVKEQLGKLEAAKYLSSKSLNRENEKHAELQAQIQVAIDASRDDLAEAAIAKQMDIEAQLPVFEKSILEDEAEIAELTSYINALQGKKREMKEALNDFAKSEKHISETAEAGGANVNQTVEQAENAFNRVLEKAGVPTSASDADAAKLAELEELARANRIKERLAKAKSGVES